MLAVVGCDGPVEAMVVGWGGPELCVVMFQVLLLRINEKITLLLVVDTIFNNQTLGFECLGPSF